MNTTFRHIYYNEWIIGKTCLRQVNGNVVNMGIVVETALVGREYDQDILIRFEKDGQQYNHTMDFDRSYKLIDTATTANTNNTL